MPTTRLLLLRHGQTTWNAERRWQGWSDTPLSGLGERQAHDAVDHLRAAGLTAAVCSDLRRARRTAEILAAGLGLGRVEVETALRERHVGLFEGHTLEEILDRWPHAFDGTGRLVSPPDGEDADTVVARIEPALLAVAERHTGGAVVVVSHGGVIRLVERHLGAEGASSVPNLGGRWVEVVDGRLVAGPAHVPLDPGLVSTPSTE